MQPTEDNLRLVMLKLSRFREWSGFPREKDAVQAAARSLARLVHNRPVRDLHACLSHDPQDCPLAYAMDMSDLDWLLDTVYENAMRWPVPAELREIYSNRFIPAENVDRYFSST